MGYSRESLGRGKGEIEEGGGEMIGGLMNTKKGFQTFFQSIERLILDGKG